MGLRMQLGGDQPSHWQRSTEPTRGLVKLRTGWNLVAWSGADQTPIDDALKGIGWSLRAVHRWNPITQQWSTWTSPERTAQLIAADNTDQEADSEMPAIRRGEALWINVARAVNWLQPTDILPRLVFPGGASTALQARVREDLEAVLAFFRTQYGIQADPNFTIYAAKDVDALLQAYKDDGQDVDDADETSTRTLWDSAGGWAGSNITVKQSDWPEGLPDDETSRGRYVITHEYFHIVQRQLPRRKHVRWLVEGTADWAEGEHQVLDGGTTRDDLRDSRSSQITTDTPTLQSTEEDNDRWEYTLGWLATNLLTASAGTDSWVEFWHRAAPIDSVAEPDWHSAFLDVFGTSVEDFYADFGAWQYATERKNIHIQGNLRAADGQPLADTWVWACLEVDGSCESGQGDHTDDSGAFAVIAPAEGSYGVHLNLDGCTIYFRNGRFTANRQERSAVRVQGDDVRLGPLTIPAELCAHQINGSITMSDGQPLADTHVSACLEVDGDCAAWPGGSTDDDGAFALTVPTEGRYRVWLNLNGCAIYFRSGGFTTEFSERGTVRVSGRDARLGPRQIPESMCAHQISGSITKSDGQPLADSRVSACLEVDGNCTTWLGGNTDDDGAFALTVPSEGRYRVWLNLNGCSIYYRLSGPTTTQAEASPISVTETSAPSLSIRVPEGMCAYQITGSISQADGQPLADTWISACLEVDGDCAVRTSTRTDDDGALAITVPTDGRYRVWLYLEGCWIYFRNGGFTTAFSERDAVRVQEDDAQLGSLTIPAGMCAHRISGRFVDSSGAPLSEKWFQVDSPGGSGGGSTDATGRFEIRVPSDGAYRFGISLRDQPHCWHWLSEQALGSRNNPIRVSGADVTGITLHLPGTIEELCK